MTGVQTCALPILAARLLMDSSPLPRMNANDMTKRCEAMLAKLDDYAAAESLFLEAVTVVDEIAGAWNRDSIRTEPISKALFHKFGQQYA